MALELLSSALQERGYHSLVFLASRTRGDVDHVLREILDYQVDGIVIASVATLIFDYFITALWRF